MPTYPPHLHHQQQQQQQQQQQPAPEAEEDGDLLMLLTGGKEEEEEEEPAQQHAAPPPSYPPYQEPVHGYQGYPGPPPGAHMGYPQHPHYSHHTHAPFQPYPDPQHSHGYPGHPQGYTGHEGFNPGSDGTSWHAHEAAARTGSMDEARAPGILPDLPSDLYHAASDASSSTAGEPWPGDPTAQQHQQQQGAAGAAAVGGKTWGVPAGEASRSGPALVDDHAFPSLSASATAPSVKRPQGSWATGVPAYRAASSETDDGDEDLQRALEASKLETRGPARVTPELAAQHAAAAPSSSSSSLLAPPGPSVGAGLINRTGEYNCFLNVIIQCLWHLRSFKRMLEPEIDRHEQYRQQHPVVAALLALFGELDESEARMEQDPMAQRPPVDPSDLREALDSIPGKNIRVGEMSDPSEVLFTIYDCLDGVSSMHSPQQRSVVDSTFGLHLHEYLECQGCGKVTHEVAEHTELFHVIAVALLTLPDFGDRMLGSALNMASSQDMKRCDKDKGGCGQAGVPEKLIDAMPQVFSVILAWEGTVDAHTIRQAMLKVEGSLVLSDVYGAGPHPVERAGGGSPSRTRYHLRSMFCYYGQHYFAFILKPEVMQWVMFDDTTITTIGSWEAVVAKCEKGRIQPCLLYYSID